MSQTQAEQASAGSAPAASLKRARARDDSAKMATHPRGLPPRPH